MTEAEDRHTFDIEITPLLPPTRAPAAASRPQGNARRCEKFVYRPDLSGRDGAKPHPAPGQCAVALREYADRRGLEIIDEYRDEGISGAKDRRPELDRLMVDARKRRFDAVLVARFDRFARSTKHLVLALEEFHALSIDFICLSESIDTSTSMGRMVFTVIAAVAELERSIIKGRGRAGVDRTKRQLWTAHGHRRPASAGRDESRRAKHQVDREGVWHCPRHRSQHPVQGGRKWCPRG